MNCGGMLHRLIMRVRCTQPLLPVCGLLVCSAKGIQLTDLCIMKKYTFFVSLSAQ